MAGLPKLPGFNFYDPTITRYHLSQTFGVCNGYKIPKKDFSGIGGRELDSNTVKYLTTKDTVPFDPSLTYGRTKSKVYPQFTPHYVLYDQKCLTFKAFFKQSVTESPNEFYRVRHVNIIYFLEDDTITVMEPRVPNSGLEQGRLVKRNKIPKDTLGNVWHWKDFNVGKDLAFYGVVYHTVDCDLFTREYMASQGLVMNDTEEMPADPYIRDRQLKERPAVTKTPPADDKLRRFLEYDGKVLKFKAAWDDRENPFGILGKYEILYFLSDDTVCVKEVHEKNDGRDPYPILLRKMKLPKRYNDTPTTYPAIYLEMTDSEVTEYYQPKDFQIGETIFVLGRDMLIYDCDKFTRNYFRKVLGIEQKPALSIDENKPKPAKNPVPPHDGLGSLEDSLQNTLTFMPKQPKKDVVKQLVNANKYLRYEMVMDAVHPEDKIRRFVLKYSLADGTCTILEPPIKNSGILGGKYLRSTYLIKPGSDPLNPDFYTPTDFYIGATIIVFQQRFIIVGADLYVYRYMMANPSKFPCEVIENIRNYMFNKGYLKDEVDEMVMDNLEEEKKWEFEDTDEKNETELEKCLAQYEKRAADPAERSKMARIREEYENSLIHKSTVEPFGVKKPTTTSPYPVEIGDVKNIECAETEGQYSHFVPKHIDTPEEILAKHYERVLKDQKEICSGKYPIECIDTPSSKNMNEEDNNKPEPVMMAKPDVPRPECLKKVRFADDANKCNIDRNDLCGLQQKPVPCHGINYEKC